MKITLKQLALVIAPTAALMVIGISAGFAGYRLNLTKSLPLGVWKITDTYARGTYVTACVPPNAPMMRIAIERRYLPDGSCPGGTAPLLKKIAAIEGDTIQLTADSVTVNGVAIANTATLAYRAIDPLPATPRGTYVVQKNQFWLIANDHARSFDSRYFGAIDGANILHGMTPALVFAQGTHDQTTK